MSTRALDDEEVLEQLASSPMKLLRFQVPWDEIEPKPGKFNWESWDLRFERLRKSRFVPLVVINTSPRWARASDDQDNRWAPPAAPYTIVPFLEAFAERYGDFVTFYQIWDEPNIAPHWGAREADPYGYLRLLQVAASTIRRMDSSAVILSAGLAPTLDPGRINRNDLGYLDELLNLGAGMWFDILAWEPYGFEVPPKMPPGLSRLNFRRIELAHKILQKYGLSQTPVWATAFGWNALSDGATSPWGSVSEQAQASYARQAVEWRNAHKAWLQTVIWTHAFPDAPVTDPVWGFALWTADKRGRPVWYALKNSSPPPSPTDASSPGTSLKRYRPPSLILPGSPGTAREFNVSGGKLQIVTLTGPRWHTLWVDIDGRPPPALPHTSTGRAYLNLYSKQLSIVRITLAEDLPPGTHTLRLISGKGDPIWPILNIETLPSHTTRTRFSTLLAALLALGMAALLSTMLPSIQFNVPPLSKWERRLLILAALVIPFATRLIHVGPYTVVLPELVLMVLGLHWGSRVMWHNWPPRAKALSSYKANAFPWFFGFSTAIFVTQFLTAIDPQAMWANVKSTLLFPLLFYVLLVHTSRTTQKKAVHAILISTAMISLWGSITLVTTTRFKAPIPRLQIFFDSPNHLALFLVRSLPFALFVPFSLKHKGRSSLLTLLLLAALLLTRSRGAWLLGIPVVFLLSWPSFPERRRYNLAPLITVALGGILVIIRGSHTFTQRLHIWKATLRLVKDVPWQGIGLGQFPWIYPRYALPGAWSEPLLYHAHNVLLTTMAFLGIPLTLLWGGALIRRLTTGASDELGRAARASLMAGLAFGLVDAFWSLPDIAYMTALGLALLLPQEEEPY